MTDEAQPAPAEYPKWIEPHNSHIAVNQYGHQVPQGFIEQSFDRVAKKFMVLVENAADEARALASKDGREEAQAAADAAERDKADSDAAKKPAPLPMPEGEPITESEHD